MTPEEIAVLQAAMGGGSKPTDPYGNEWTGDQRVAALRANGYTWSTLNPPGAGGPGALWVDRYGRTVPESAALQDVLKPPGAPKAQEAPDRITSGGIVYERSADGQWRPAQGIPAASTGDGVGWANLAENKRQFDITQQQRLEDNAARMAEAQKRYEQEQQKINDARAVNAANLLFNQNKEAFAQATQNKQLALQARGQLMQEQQTALDIQLKQSTLDQNWAQFNATMQQRVAEANQQFENQRQERLANIATQAGTLAQDAGDRGKLAATMLAHSGWGKQNQALAGQNYITDESLTPLESLLRTREQVKSQASPYTFTPIERPARLNMPALPDLNAMMAGMQTPQTVANPQAGSGVFNPQTGQQLSEIGRAHV